MEFFYNYDPFFERYAHFWDFLELIGWFGTAFMVLLFIELTYDAIKNRGKGLKDSLANLSFIAVDYWIETTLYSLFLIAILLKFEPYAFFHIPMTPWTWVICLFITDFTYYWMHRSEHMVRFFWAHHSIHHSSESYNLTTAGRLFWFLDIFIWIYYVPMVLIGFDLAQTLSCMLIVFIYMSWIHTEKIGRMGWFELVFNSASFHRGHHGRNKIYIDKNFAGLFVFWDKLFGTFQEETVPVDF